MLDQLCPDHMRNLFVGLITVVLIAGLAAPIAGADGSQAASASEIECDFPVTVEDATGTDVTLVEPPERVVTTNPSAAQIMWEIDAFDQVVGLTEHALYLEGADEREIVSKEDDVGVSLERVVELEPDLVLAPNATGTEAVEQMRDAGLTVYHFPMDGDLDDVFEKTERIGQLTDACAGAQATTDWMDGQLDIVANAVEGEERPGVMYMFFDFTAGSGTFVTDLIERAGASNLAAEAGVEGYQPISEEVVIEQDPDWIILNSNDPALPGSEAINETTAAQEDQIVIVEIDHLNQPAPRNVLAILTLVEVFHPEAYEEAKAEAETDDTEEEADDAPFDDDDAVVETDDDADGAAEVDDTDTDDETDPIPGFGPAIAGVGVFLATLFLHRRR